MTLATFRPVTLTATLDLTLLVVPRPPDHCKAIALAIGWPAPAIDPAAPTLAKLVHGL
jgi:hypothetical protein